jgi:hypothetical protein
LEGRDDGNPLDELAKPPGIHRPTLKKQRELIEKLYLECLEPSEEMQAWALIEESEDARAYWEELNGDEDDEEDEAAILAIHQKILQKMPWLQAAEPVAPNDLASAMAALHLPNPPQPFANSPLTRDPATGAKPLRTPHTPTPAKLVASLDSFAPPPPKAPNG